MLVTKTLGNLSGMHDGGRAIDRLPLEWHECNKRFFTKRTGAGREVTVKFQHEPGGLQQDDVLYADEKCLVVVEVLACEAIAVQPSSVQQLACACYEIGSRQLPLFYEEGNLYLPHDGAAFRWLQAAGFEPQLLQKKLQGLLRITTTPSSNPAEGKGNFFAKILKRTATAADD